MDIYKNNPLWNSPIRDYLYRNASIAYATEVGILNPYVRNIWINSYIQNEVEWFDNQISSIQEDIEN